MNIQSNVDGRKWVRIDIGLLLVQLLLWASIALFPATTYVLLRELMMPMSLPWTALLCTCYLDVIIKSILSLSKLSWFRR